MTSDPEALVEAGRQTLAEFRRAHDEAVAAVVRVVEAETGVTLAVPSSPPIMDATRDQLMAADLRAQHAVAAMDIALRQWTWGEARTLGEFVRGLPPEVAARLADHLAEAGLS
ncbi:hypothetical protein [Streptomyces parvulus]|uniref:hypothetical protein n=1 Tax=Streptomyces parvulus TaxID=146923 RepID=UPI00210DC4C9|nr:hypothetical protein [Streptomyces parvulus]MCQ4193860.1 hypothetical protein [Streptomyces parvulus]